MRLLGNFLASLSIGLALTAAQCAADLLDWQSLRNPVYSHSDWSTKDASMIYNESTGWFYLFFSAFYYDDGQERSHVVGVRTRDFVTFSDTLFSWDGRTDGWLGMCSPNINKIGATYILTYNSWGDKSGKPNQLFYATSPDLETWDNDRSLGSNLTTGKRAIDAAVAFENNKYYLIWKQDGPPGSPRIAVGGSLSGAFAMIGDGRPALQSAATGADNGRTHENYELIKINGRWMMLTTDYTPHEPWLYSMEAVGDQDIHWKRWVGGRSLQSLIPQESFNTDHRANSAFLADWRAHDGYFYLLYAGRTEGLTHAGRGDNKLAIARSADLLTFAVPAHATIALQRLDGRSVMTAAQAQFDIRGRRLAYTADRGHSGCCIGIATDGRRVVRMTAHLR